MPAISFLRKYKWKQLFVRLDIMKNPLKVYLSADPGQEFSRDILQFPFIEGIRCNTGAPVNQPKEKVLKYFQAGIYPIKAWVDLKCRELRIIKAAKIR